MAVATGTAILGAAGLAIAGGIGSSLIQSEAARDAAREQRRSIQKSTQLQQQGFEQAREIQDPFLRGGQQAFGTLSDLVTQGLQQPQEQLPVLTQGQGFTPGQFSISDITQDPGIQFAQEQAQQAVERSAAARGGLLGGGTLRELTREATGLAGQQAGQAFNRFLGQQQLGLSGAQQRLGAEQQQFGQALTSRQQGQAERGAALNRLAGLAQVGPQTATALGNQAIGQGGTLGGLALQTGNVNAAQQAAQGQALSGGLQSTDGLLQDLLLFHSPLGQEGTNQSGGTNQTLPPINTIPPPINTGFDGSRRRRF